MARAALILAFLSMCLFTVRGSSDEACSSDQCNAGNTSGLGLLQTRGDLKKVQVATADEDTNTDLDKMAEKQGPLTAGEFFLDKRPQQRVLVHVPEGDGPFPVLIGLHGSGGLSVITMDRFSVTPGHIVVCPKRNNEDDLEFVHELMDHLSGFSNVVPTGFKLAGYSQGADKTNHIAIESDDPRITHIITMMSQLHLQQYHTGHFWADAGRPKDSIHRRKLIQFTGLKDRRCVCCDSSVDTCGGYLLTWEESAYAYAKAWGYTGKQLEAVESEMDFHVSYLGGLVQAFNIKSLGHAMPPQVWAHFAPDFLKTGPSEAAETAPSSEAAPKPSPTPAEEESIDDSGAQAEEEEKAEPSTTTQDNYRWDGRTAGGRGVGVCTCPSGAKYVVGDEKNYCKSLACEGGVSGDCTGKKDGGKFSRDEGGQMRVTCAAK